MCVLCYDLAPAEHWSNEVSDGDSNDLPGRSRYRRTRILSAVLAPYGLTVSDPGSGSYCVIADRKGSAEVVAGLPAVWQAAGRLSPSEIDVLDPELLHALTMGGPA